MDHGRDTHKIYEGPEAGARHAARGRGEGCSGRNGERAHTEHRRSGCEHRGGDAGGGNGRDECTTNTGSTRQPKGGRGRTRDGAREWERGRGQGRGCARVQHATDARTAAGGDAGQQGDATEHPNNSSSSNKSGSGRGARARRQEKRGEGGTRGTRRWGCARGGSTTDTEREDDDTQARSK